MSSHVITQDIALIDTGALSRRQREALAAWLPAAESALPPNTWRAYRADLLIFHEFAQGREQATLPADPQLIVRFIQEQASEGKSLATIRRYISSLAKWHAVIDAPDPTKDELASLALKKAARELGSRQDQAEPLGWSRLQRITDYHDQKAQSVGWVRDKALLWLAYDLLARRSELVQMNWGDLGVTRSSAVATITQSKTDQDAEGHTSYVAGSTHQYLTDWRLEVESHPNLPQIEDQHPVFVRLYRGGRITGDRLREQSVNLVVKARGACLGLSETAAAGLSGHSMRVGAAQDLVEANFGTAALKQAGRWVSDRMPAKYTAELRAARGAMAKLAARQGRA